MDFYLMSAAVMAVVAFLKLRKAQKRLGGMPKAASKIKRAHTKTRVGSTVFSR